MNCYLCHEEKIATPSTGLCAVCNDPACRRPSSRDDGTVHGENCRSPTCGDFVCVLHTHDHLAKLTPLVVSQTIPTCFPFLTVDVAFNAWVAAESSFPDRSKGELPNDANLAFTYAAGLLDRPEWENPALSMQAVATGWVATGKDRRSPYLVNPDYFDPIRIARLCLRAAGAFTIAWSQFTEDERPKFRPSFRHPVREPTASSKMDEVVHQFVSQPTTDSVEFEVTRLGILSPRLAAFLSDVVAAFPHAVQPFAYPATNVPERVSPVRPPVLEFRPSGHSERLEMTLAGWVLA